MGEDKVVPFRTRGQRIRNAGEDAGFLGCPRCQGDEWAVVCRGLPGRPYIAALICAECENPITEINVVQGVISLA